MDCKQPARLLHGILQARILEWVAISFSRASSPTQGLNLGLLHCWQILYHLSHQGNIETVNLALILKSQVRMCSFVFALQPSSVIYSYHKPGTGVSACYPSAVLEIQNSFPEQFS